MLDVIQSQQSLDIVVNQSNSSLESIKLQRFFLSVSSFDNQRLIFHAARQTLRKAEMTRLVVHEWLEQHEPELEEWKVKTASQLGISVSELERQLLAAANYQARANRTKDNTDSE